MKYICYLILAVIFVAYMLPSSRHEGNHFNSGDGIFVAPVSGTYQFSWTTITTSGKLTETELRVDNAIQETLNGGQNYKLNIFIYEIHLLFNFCCRFRYIDVTIKLTSTVRESTFQ
jgi:hypothetical protein